MSKKLIAVASATALAVSALVAAPAIASGPTAVFTTLAASSTAGTSAALPATINVPAGNALINSETPANSTAATLTITGVATGDVVRITTTGAVKVIDDLEGLGTANSRWNVTTFGAATWEDTTTDNAPVVAFVYTTSTTAGTVAVSVTRTGLTYNSTLHIKGVEGPAYNIVNVTGVPATLAKDATSDVTFTTTDVFGNVKENDSTAITYVNANKSSDLGTFAWDPTAKVYKAKLTSPSASPFLVDFSIRAAASDVAGLPKAVRSSTSVVNFSSATLNAQIAALTAQLAESRPKANSVTKKRFNKLARKWNAAFPSQRVALKK
jgi:hypothetical protein